MPPRPAFSCSWRNTTNLLKLTEMKQLKSFIILTFIPEWGGMASPFDHPSLTKGQHQSTYKNQKRENIKKTERKGQRKRCVGEWDLQTSDYGAYHKSHSRYGWHQELRVQRKQRRTRRSMEWLGWH
jgi:hypothetical protein